jgi:predicted acyltransferase
VSISGQPSAAAIPSPQPEDRGAGARRTSERLLSLDVFRGLTIAGMLLVNLPGTWSAIFPPIEHKEWHGWSGADLIFPFFLFIVGITTYLSLSARRARGADDRALMLQVLRRGGMIILIGLLFSAFPYYPLTRITELRIPGVLPRIGVTYILGAMLTLRTSLRQQIIIIATLLYGYWILMTIVPIPGYGLGGLLLNQPPLTMAAYWDRALLDGHLWKLSKTWDPEGTLSTLPAIATVMFGVLAGRWIGTGKSLSERISALAAVGGIGATLGLMWNWSFPINKGIWTSSYVLFTAGIACIALAACMWVIDVHRVRGWTKPFVIFGLNPIVAFVGTEVMARLMYSVIKVPFRGKTVSLQSAIYESLFAGWLPPKVASLAFAVSMLLLWLGILTVLYRKQIVIKV